MNLSEVLSERTYAVSFMGLDSDGNRILIAEENSLTLGTQYERVMLKLFLKDAYKEGELSISVVGTVQDQENYRDHRFRRVRRHMGMPTRVCP
ncbi:MAG: hypothetical protein HRT44_10265 [Bdellovibrionales bacterium]|nr:hypothetical protein [Bdellovibrionales bacterium]NQZ19623.1 hypothetical protein [Bdellovibrionales bacterium]